MAIVIWRKKANHSRMNVLLYGQKEFGLHVANKMNRRIEHCAALLADHPRLGKIEPLLVGRRFEYRSLVIHEHYKLIYHINDNNGVIYITDLFDTRREPKRLAENI